MFDPNSARKHEGKSQNGRNLCENVEMGQTMGKITNLVRGKTHVSFRELSQKGNKELPVKMPRSR